MKASLTFHLQLIAILWAMCLLPSALCAQSDLDTPDVFLCSAAGAPVSYDIAADITGSFVTLSISSPSMYGVAIIDASGMLLYTPTVGTTQVIDQFSYAACNATGACSLGVINITLADIESLPPIVPDYHYYSVNFPFTTDICNGNIGWELQHNGEASLYTVWVTHDESLGSLSYISDGCILYTPSAAGSDTIKVIGCGDAPPPYLLTCNGWEQMDPCSYTYYVINISPNISTSFIENHSIACDSTLTIDGLGYPTWAIPSIIDAPTNGTATIVSDGINSSLQYTPPAGFAGIDTVIVECAHATQITCSTGMYIFEVNCATEGYHFSENHTAVCLETQYIGVGCGNTPTITEPPQNGIATILYGDACNMLVYMPFGTFMGQDQVGVACAAIDTSGVCQNGLYKIDVICEPGSNSNILVVPLDCDSTYTSGYMAGGWGSSPFILLPPKHGTAVVESEHYLKYTPEAGFTGSDTVWVDCSSSGPADGCQSVLLIFQVDCTDNILLSTLDADVIIGNELGSQYLQINFDNGVLPIGHIVLTDMAGRVVAQCSNNAQNIGLEIPIYQLPNGVYIVTVPTSRGMINRKIIILK